MDVQHTKSRDYYNEKTAAHHVQKVESCDINTYMLRRKFKWMLRCEKDVRFGMKKENKGSNAITCDVFLMCFTITTSRSLQMDRKRDILVSVKKKTF